MGKCFRYSLLDAEITYGVKKHAQTDMRELGFVLLNSEPVSISDCWIFEVDDTDENYPKEIPPYLNEIRSDYFTREWEPKKTIIAKPKKDEPPIQPGDVVVQYKDCFGKTHRKTLHGFLKR